MYKIQYNKYVYTIWSFIRQRPPFYMEFGQKFELDTLGGMNFPDGKPVIVHQVEVSRNKRGYVHVSIIGDASRPTTRIDIAFMPFVGVYDFGVEYWYEHPLNAMLGPGWHHAGCGAGGDKIFADLSDEVLHKSLTTISVAIAKLPLPLFNAPARYVYQTARILSFLASDEGKQYRSKNEGVRQMYEDRKRRDKVYRRLSRM